MTTPNNTVAGLAAKPTEREALQTCYDALMKFAGQAFDAPPPWSDLTIAVEAAGEALASPAPNAGVVDDASELLRELGLDPERFRTEGGSLNAGKVRAALLHPADYSGLYLPRAHAFAHSAKLGGEVCTYCGAMKGTRRADESCAALSQHPAAPSVSPAVAGDGLPPEFVTCDDCGTPVEAHCPKCAAASSAPQGEPIGYIDPEAAFLFPAKDGCVLSAHFDVVLVRDQGGKYTQPIYTTPPPAAEQPQGEMVLVPREPTQAMTNAYHEAQKAAVLASDKAWGISNPAQTFADGYRAMLSAAPSRPVVDDAAAKRLYDDYSGNHPTIHCNRFPAWSELDESSKREWRAKAAALAGKDGA